MLGSTVVFTIPKTSAKFGYCMVIGAALFAALLHVVGKPLLGQNGQDFDIHPIILAAIIFIINGIFFSGLSKKSTPIKSIGRKNIILMIIIGITEVSDQIQLGEQSFHKESLRMDQSLTILIFHEILLMQLP